MTLKIIFLLLKIHLIVSGQVETESRIFMRIIFARDVFPCCADLAKERFLLLIKIRSETNWEDLRKYAQG